MIVYPFGVKAVVKDDQKQNKLLTDLRFGSNSAKLHSFMGMLKVNVFEKANVFRFHSKKEKKLCSVSTLLL